MKCVIIEKIPLNSENSNTRDLAQILVYLGNGLLVSQFYRMLYQDIKILVILLLYCFDMEIRLKYMSHFTYACKMRCPLNLVLENWENLHFY